MGALLSKALDGLLVKATEETITVQTETGTPKPAISEDPRSPASAGVDRTPLPFTAALEHQNPCDPRSPTMGILRTPLQAPIFETPPDTPTHVDQVVVEAPVETAAEECSIDVHRTWDFDNTDVDEGNSLYPNPPSFPRCGADDSLSDHGSLENLLMYDTSANESADSALISADIAEDEECEQELGSEEVIVADAEASEELSVSPIGSPVKNAEMISSQSSGPLLPPPTAFGDESSRIRSSTPNGKITSGRTRVGLTQRDTNSPLSIVQRKQVAKVVRGLSARGDEGNAVAVKGSRESSFTVPQDKENRV